MNKEVIKRMFEIESKAQMGDSISKNDVIFFNSNLDQMKRDIEEEYIHWSNHVHKL